MPIKVLYTLLRGLDLNTLVANIQRRLHATDIVAKEGWLLDTLNRAQQQYANESTPEARSVAEFLFAIRLTIAEHHITF